MTTLYLARHGETVENAEHILQGHLPGHLTSLGFQQAEALRDLLKPVCFDAILCSDLHRAIQTADVVAGPHGLTPERLSLLRERDWGELTGMAIATLKDKITQPFPPSVETVEAMCRRAQAFIDLLVERHAGQTVLVVAHGLFNRYMQSVILGRDAKGITRMGNGECRIFHLSDDGKVAL